YLDGHLDARDGRRRSDAAPARRAPVHPGFRTVDAAAHAAPQCDRAGRSDRLLHERRGHAAPHRPTAGHARRHDHRGAGWFYLTTAAAPSTAARTRLSTL